MCIYDTHTHAHTHPFQNHPKFIQIYMANIKRQATAIPNTVTDQSHPSPHSNVAPNFPILK